MSSSPPTTLGQYQIIREIARSNDIVYEAYDPQMDRRVALKELSLPNGITEPQKADRVQRFDREAKAAGRLAHPNIMRVFQVASDGDRHYMAMEFLDGHTLRNEIDTKGFLPVDRAVEIAIAVLKGLGHAHANGVVHRDIKPDNIQLLSSGEIKITDFGIARLTFQPNLTMDGQVFGTPSYMSPEQVVGKDIDARSDLFSVGILLYEMVSGGKPFVGDSVVAITYNIMNHEPSVLSQVNHSMWQVISKALDKSPALRFSSAHEMIDALEQASKQSIVLDSPMAPPGQTIFGPAGSYPMAPPVLNPYGQPYGVQAPPPVPPPVVYPYNPYQTGMGGSMPPHTPGYAPQGFPQTPIYYPPPPRQPLFKPETKHFIGKLFLVLLVMGTAVAVAILLAAGIGQAISDSKKQSNDMATVTSIAAIRKEKIATQAKIDKIENLINKLSPVSRSAEKRNLAVLYEQIGIDHMKKEDAVSLTSAENAFMSANELDPDNPKYMSDLAMVYWKFAGLQRATEDRIPIYEKSVDWWERAARVSGSNAEERNGYYDAAAKTCYAMANELFRVQQYARAHEAAANGMGMAIENSQTYRDLEALDNQIRQSGQ
jgi:eukaryotic-like serine/threonine-protein kinase